MTLINLTPHAVTICALHGFPILTVPTSGAVAQCRVERWHDERIMVGVLHIHIPIAVPEYSDIEGLPDPEPGVGYIVSAMVRQASGRPDVFSPGDAIRDDQGHVIGCRGLDANR